MNNIVYLQDCMEGMKQYPDKYFDLAIVDPPYGINIKAIQGVSTIGIVRKKYTNFDDTTPPPAEYWHELERVSKNRIVWGGNYFINHLQPSKCFIFWDKHRRGLSMADGELAWTTFDEPARVFDYKWNGMIQEHMNDREIRIHPTQKPVALYEWLLNNYAKQGDKILDTHVGSGSSRIAAYNLGYDFTGYEIDPVYWEAQEKRFREHAQQINLFVDEVTV